MPHENPSIGIILCKTKDRIIVEYALKNSEKPIGVGEYRSEQTAQGHERTAAYAGADRDAFGG
jgi:hypothetical protein